MSARLVVVRAVDAACGTLGDGEASELVDAALAVMAAGGRRAALLLLREVVDRQPLGSPGGAEHHSEGEEGSRGAGGTTAG